MLRRIPALAALVVVSLALAQELPVVPEIPPLPADVSVTPAPPALALPSPARPVTQAPVALPGVSGTLTVARTVQGPLPLTFTVSAGTTPLVIGVRRDNAQHCVFAPLVRVVRVGTQEVVYPAAGAQRRLCTQEFVTKSTAATGTASFSRDLTLPPGEYMLESWLTGLANGVPVRVPASPVRVTVR